MQKDTIVERMHTVKIIREEKVLQLNQVPAGREAIWRMQCFNTCLYPKLSKEVL